MAKRILFVDDDQDWRAMVATCLNDAGYEVQTAKDAGEALAQSEGVRPDLVILDVDLAGESGVTLMQFLKRNHPDVPILLYTGLDHNDDTILALLSQGAHRYLPKGKLADLLATVRGILNEFDSVG
jgi:DNA-binding response OmpR family regulator